MFRLARVRFLRDVPVRNVSPGTEYIYRKGDIRTMMEPEATPGKWWSDGAIDGAYIVPGDAVEIVQEIAPGALP